MSLIIRKQMKEAIKWDEWHMNDMLCKGSNLRTLLIKDQKENPMPKEKRRRLESLMAELIKKHIKERGLL